MPVLTRSAPLLLPLHAAAKAFLPAGKREGVPEKNGLGRATPTPPSQIVQEIEKPHSFVFLVVQI
jgi:hypothetical protein